VQLFIHRDSIAAAQHFHVDFTIRIFSGPEQFRCYTLERALKWELTSPSMGPLLNAVLIISSSFVSFLEEIDGLFPMLLQTIGAKSH
jgi:hypothetical protein